MLPQIPLSRPRREPHGWHVSSRTSQSVGKGQLLFFFSWESHCHEARPDSILAMISQLCIKCVDKQRTEGYACCLSLFSAR